MTEADWRSLMVRYMHRTDLTGDLDATLTLTRDRIESDWMGEVPWLDTDGMLDTAPTAAQHAGLMFLHELAQDTANFQAEAGLYGNAIAAAQRRWSHNNVTPIMKTPEAL